MNPSEHAAHSEHTKHPGTPLTYVMASDSDTFAELEAAITTLPLCARGRVFVEVASMDDISYLVVPPRMTVTWLPRSTRSGAPGTGERCSTGEALERAVQAWSSEMLCHEANDVRVWLGGDYRAVAAIAENLIDVCGVAPDAITTPPAFGLATRHGAHSV